MSTAALTGPPSTVMARPGARSGTVLRSPFPVWAALFANVLAFSGQATVVPIPGVVGQLITQGALLLALLLALMLNRSVVLRPNLFLVLLSMLAIVALATSIHNVFVLGSVFRSCRLFGFTVGLWLLTPWWGRDDMILLRCHLRMLRIVLATVVLGVLVAPGTAFSYQGRLSGAVWPMPPTQVAHYSAILLGSTIVLWLCHVVRGRTALATLVVAGLLLIGTHTRTALLALLTGLLVSGASLFLGRARVRRSSAVVAGFVVLGATVFAPAVTTWLRRGQTTQEATNLTGRTEVWSAVFSTPRSELAQLFGSGMSNKSFGGLPIDSNWVATYVDQGYFGISVEVAILLALFFLAVIRPGGPKRAVALFLVTYCVIASITETGLGDASPYLLDLSVAAALLATTARGVDP